MKKSNCHLTAWSKFRLEVASSLSVQYSKNSKIHTFLKKYPKVKLILMPIVVTGILLQWAAWTLVQLGEILRTGRWYHVTWREGDTHKEFVPLDKPVAKWFPPLLFEGKEQEVPNEYNIKT